MKKTLGIIGGVGPLATMHIGEKIVRLTKATKDQEHIHMIIDNDTTIPDRTAYILNHNEENPIPFLQRDVTRLTEMGAEVICIPCNTAHAFYEEMQQATSAQFIHMIRETAVHAKVQQAKRVGILATDGTLSARVYQQALEALQLDVIVPDATVQKQVMAVIYDYIKAGKQVTLDVWQPIEQVMLEQGCDSIILGCTELSIVRDQLQLHSHYIDSLTVLAQVAIRACGYELNEDFK